MKKVYIAHPLRGDVVGNMEKVTLICQKLHQQGEVLPVSPLHAFSFVDPAGPQETVFQYCRSLLLACDELWVHGNWKESEGCRMEVDVAQTVGMPIVVFSERRSK